MAVTPWPYPWQKALWQELNGLRERLPNGVLIYGSRGCGTFEAAAAFAASLLCEHPASDGAPCRACHGCAMVSAHTHPDLQYVVSEFESVPRELPYVSADRSSADKKTLTREILIHQTRALTDFLNLKSHEGGRRVVLVYPADMIRAEAAASLLKSLEEPPENLVFILVADEIDRVLPTIRSRCRLVHAATPSREASLAWLREQGLEDAEQRLVNAGGMPVTAAQGDARFEMEPDVRAKFLDLLALGRAGNMAHIARAVPKFGAPSLPAVALLLARWGWDLASARAGGPVRYFPDYAEVIRELAGHSDPIKLFTWINTVRDLRRVADHPLNAKTVIDAILLSYQRHI